MRCDGAHASFHSTTSISNKCIMSTRPIVRLFVSVFALFLASPPAGWCAEAGAPFYYRQAELRNRAVRECEVAVYGGTPAGVTAAVQAARMVSRR